MHIMGSIFWDQFWDKFPAAVAAIASAAAVIIGALNRQKINQIHTQMGLAKTAKKD